VKLQLTRTWWSSMYVDGDGGDGSLVPWALLRLALLVCVPFSDHSLFRERSRMFLRLTVCTKIRTQVILK